MADDNNVHGSLGGTEETNNLAQLNKIQVVSPIGGGGLNSQPPVRQSINESVIQGIAQQNVEAVKFGSGLPGAGGNPVLNVANNNDEVEPGKAMINQQVQIQQRQISQKQSSMGVAASMQASSMPKRMVSDQISMGGKSQLHQRNMNAQDLLGEGVVTRSHYTTEEQYTMLNKDRLNEMNEQIQLQQIQKSHQQQRLEQQPPILIDEPTNTYQAEQAQQTTGAPPNMYQNWKQDPKLLTKSTMNDDQDRQKFLPKIVGESQQPANGYISDFYKKKQYPTSDSSQKVGMQINSNMQNAAIGTDPIPSNKLNKISSKKFFKSKIDFTAPIKSLQHKGGTNDANLSDDSYMVEAQQSAFRQFTQGQLPPPGPSQSHTQSHMPMMGGRAVNKSEIINKPADKYTAGEQPLTQMEGYTNLSLIQEEDFNKRGVGHLHAKNASKRVYQTQSKRELNHSSGVSLKVRKASEATTVGQNGSNPGPRKQYQSVDNRFSTPLKLPNLRTSGAKKNSHSNANKRVVSNLSTVVESTYSKVPSAQAHQHVNGKMCLICAKKHKVGQHHPSQSGNSTASGVKGAPYFQPMNVQKQQVQRQPNPTIGQRSISNGRAKSYNRQLRQNQPKWINKEYKPVFKMGTGSGAEASHTISHHHENSGEFTPQAHGAKKPDMVTLSHSQARFDQGALSPRSDQQPMSISAAPFNNSFKRNSPSQSKMSQKMTNNGSQMAKSVNRSEPHTVYQDNNTQQMQRSHNNGSMTRNQVGPSAAMAHKMNSTGSTVYSITPQAQQQIQQYKQIPMAYRSINKFDQTFQSQGSRVMEQSRHPQDPELVCTEKQLPTNIEEEIKDGFFELKQKFKDVGPSSIYISHVTLHEKHPLLKKIEIDTLKTLLLESSVIYLAVNQTLYRYGSQDNFVYIILFGKLLLQVPDGRNSNRLPAASNGNDTEVDNMTQLSQQTQHLIGRVNIGWTLGEEILFDRNLQIRQEMAVAESESCLIGINKAQLAIMQKQLLEQGNEKDYFVIESILKGNFLVKDQWRKEFNESLLHSKGQRSETSQSNITNANIQVMNPAAQQRGR